MINCTRSANNSSNCFYAGLGSSSLLICMCSLSFISFFGAVGVWCGDEPCGFHRCETDAHQGRKVRRGVLVFGSVVVTLWICSFQTSLEMRDVLLLTPPPSPLLHTRTHILLRLSIVSHPASAICKLCCGCGIQSEIHTVLHKQKRWSHGLGGCSRGDDFMSPQAFPGLPVASVLRQLHSFLAGPLPGGALDGSIFQLGGVQDFKLVFKSPFLASCWAATQVKLAVVLGNLILMQLVLRCTLEASDVEGLKNPQVAAEHGPCWDYW